MALDELSSLTLVGKPFARLHGLWLSAERQEVALDDVFAVGRVEPEGKRTWDVVGIDDLFCRGHDADRHRDRGGCGLEGRNTRGQARQGPNALEGTVPAGKGGA